MADQASHTLRTSASYNAALGITQRATPLDAAWTGELRVRFSDFQVNEIAENGSVIHLKMVGLGEEEKQEKSAEAPAKQTEEKNAEEKKGPEDKGASTNGKENDGSSSQPQETLDVPTEDVEILQTLAGEKFAQDIVEMYKSPPGDNDKKKSVTSEPLDDRTKRGLIHREIRRIFKSRIDTNTDDSGAIIATLIPPRKAGKAKRSRGNRGTRDDKPTGEYLHFTLFKENRDTMDAVSQIARFLKAKPQSIGYAGTKDRRASTAQRCSARYTRSRNLAGINGRLWGVTTGDYEYSDRPIHLGELLGNEFVITIKDCHIVGEDTTASIAQRVGNLQTSVDKALGHMSQHGWINYFGHQRFGTHEIGTHEIGKLILSDKYEDAVRAILHYDPAKAAERDLPPDEASKRDELARNRACMLFLTGADVAAAREMLPRRFSAEQSVFRHLDRMGEKSRGDYVGALVHITRGLRSMYLHAYQSYVWNHAASHRWELHGRAVVAGDLVLAPAEAAPLVSGQDQDGDDIINPVDDDDDASTRARPLTQEEADSGTYTIYDVVLPTPGYEVVYPTNTLGDFYVSLMARDGLDPHKMRRMRREFSLPGRYRALMNRFLAPPSVEVRPYVDDTEQMHDTDLDVLKKAGKKRAREDDASEPAGKKAKLEDGSEAKAEVKDEREERVAVVVKFQLGRSAYATVALRELMGDSPEETTS